jgi:hypothetical protein
VRFGIAPLSETMGDPRERVALGGGVAEKGSVISFNRFDEVQPSVGCYQA